MTGNVAVYDLGVSPPTWDMMVFLMGAKAHFGGADFEVVIQPGPAGGFRFDGLPPVPEMRQQMLWNVALPLIQLVPEIKGVRLPTRLLDNPPLSGGADDGALFPAGYDARGSRKAFYGLKNVLDLMSLPSPPYVVPPEWARRYVRARLPQRPVIITLRHTSYWPERNSRLGDWLSIARGIERMGFTPVIVRDPSRPVDLGGFSEFDAVELNVVCRCALYEAAEMSLFVNNGPHCLAFWHEKAPYLIFDMIGPSPATTEDYFRGVGFPPGSQFPTGGPKRRIVWERPEPKIVLATFEEAMK